MCSHKPELDENVIINYLNDEEWQQLTQYLNEIFTISIDDITGQPRPLSVTLRTVNTLSRILKDLSDKKFGAATANVLTFTKEIFRSLRNCVVFNIVAQNFIINDQVILLSTYRIIHDLIELSVPGGNECVKVSLQFLTNLVAKNSDNVDTIWEVFGGIIIQLFVESEYSYQASALLYNMVYLKRNLVKECNKVYTYVFENDGNEYHAFLLEMFVQDVDFMNSYSTFKTAHRIAILSTLKTVTVNDNECVLNSSIVQCLSTLFKNKSDCILKTVTSDVDSVEPQEVVLLLEILAALSAKELYLKQLQDDTSLLINCAFLLKNIHILGKESQNNFTPIQKLSEVTSCSDETQNNPVFGFKVELIRYLSNVCWKNKQNQDKLRELDCIPLLLDCCNIDARNPLIIQWTIFAIRNLCQNNPSNQAIIAAMTKQNVVDSSILQEMGLTLHDDGRNTIGVVPLDEITPR